MFHVKQYQVWGQVRSRNGCVQETPGAKKDGTPESEGLAVNKTVPGMGTGLVPGLRTGIKTGILPLFD